MDLFFNYLFWLAMLFILLTLFYYYFTWNFDYWEKQGIPHQKPMPIFGNINVSSKKRMHEFDTMRYKKYGRVFGTYEGRQVGLYVADPDLLKQLLLKDFYTTFVNHRRFENTKRQSLMNKMLFNLRDEEWKTMRNALTPTFTSGKLKQMTEQMEECSSNLNDYFATYATNNKPVDMMKCFRTYTLDVIANCVFGVEINATENANSTFINYSEHFFKVTKLFLFLFMIHPNLPAWLNVEAISQEALEFFVSKVKEIIELRKINKQGRKCFIDLMLEAQNSEKENKTVITETAIIAQSVSFLFAGVETSSITLSFIAYSLATNSHVQEKLINEIDEVMENNSGKVTYSVVKQMTYLDMVINETLRMYPPLVRVDRQCTEDNYKLGNATINKSVAVIIPIYCIHYDEEFYPDPDKFDPERFSPENKPNINPYTYLPFGLGPRSCIGNRFALMQIKLGLVHLLLKYRFVTCPQTEIPVEIKVDAGDLLTPVSITLGLEMRNEN